MDQPKIFTAEPQDPPPFKDVIDFVSGQLRPAIVGFMILTVLTGGLYPLILLVGAQLLPMQANGSLIWRDGIVVGSRFIGQSFTKPEYFHSRPSAAGDGYDGTQSGGRNLAPANPKLVVAIRDAASRFRRLNGLPPDAVVPIDAVTSSGSGLDPQISPENAYLQVNRVAKARHLSIHDVRVIVDAYTKGRQFGILGEPRTSVLEINLALDQINRRTRG